MKMAVLWNIHYSNLLVSNTWGERHLNQLPLQRRIVQQTLQNFTQFAAPNLTSQTKLIQTLLFRCTQLIY